ncbi:MAG: U32 family peptidase, partial [Planctomycetales bacterium]|nr:U32 family peptidase [Planctomycetales bacterium]
KRLDEARITRPLPFAEELQTSKMLAEVSNARPTSLGNEKQSILRVLCRSLTQLEVVLEAGVKDIVADFHDIRQYRQAVPLARQAGAHIALATLRIHKPGEDGLFLALAKQQADSWLVRNLSALRFCQQQQIPFAVDFSLNVTNPLTAEQLIRWGAARVTASYDLNRDQLCELAQHLPAAWLEVVVHQHMPMFHMEHCVFCSVLSPGKDKSDCGRPCDRHDVQLRDRVGAEHVLHADIGCRNTLYNSTAQSGAEAVEPLQQLGIRQFRVELLRDAPREEVLELVHMYRDLLAGKLAGGAVWRQLKAHNRVGVTRGTLEQPRNPLAIL